MPNEIEVKFLVKTMPTIPPDTKHVCIKQGYMFSTPECTVRVRIVDDKQGFITIKGRKVGIINTEFEYEISLQEAKDAFAFCNDIVIEKTRYYLPNGKHTIELDVFQGKHEGLIIAEIELQDEKDDYIKPSWFDTDVSRLLSFTNVSLARSGRNV